MRWLSRRDVLVGLVAWSAWACRRPGETSRCAYCGMRVAPASRWRVDATDGTGHARVFDTPACMFRFRTQRGALRQIRVTEYYANAASRMDASAVVFAIGSDVIGPMGRDLVPVTREHLATFQADHHPTATYDLGAVNAAVLAGL